MRKSKYIPLATVLFFLVAVLDILGVVLDEKILRYVFKPLTIPVLVLVYVLSVKERNKTYLLALLFSLIADVLILNDSDGYFILTIGFFLIMHLTYLIVLTNTIYDYNKKSLVLAVIPYSLVLISVLFFVYKNLSNFLFPILIYGFVVCSFGALSFYNYLEKRSTTALLLVFGSFFFIISNSMSAFGKFHLKNDELEIGIMLTYVVAQFLICQYVIKTSETT
tara:strand:- start:169854 stop:170519 length:666 start_codon:yes stop_codon:yes gene_type:complete